MDVLEKGDAMRQGITITRARVADHADVRMLLLKAAPDFFAPLLPDDAAAEALLSLPGSPLNACHVKMALGGPLPAGVALTYSGRHMHRWADASSLGSQAEELLHALSEAVDASVAHEVSYIPFLSVVPDLRRHGVGTSLIVSVIEEAAELPVVIDAPEGNRDAIRLCRALGFEEGDVEDGLGGVGPRVVKMMHRPIQAWC